VSLARLAESLFNDATSLLVFRAVGGTLAGAVVAVGVAVVRRRTEDPVPESVISLLTQRALDLEDAGLEEH
jgi:NhaP-type Na+/H+ or K+/H+ antiporter